MSDKIAFWVSAIVLFAGTGACASTPSGEDVRALEQPFGSSSCSTATADVVTSGTTGSLVSPASYDTCFRGYVVDVHNMGSGSSPRIAAYWNGPALTTQEACEQAWGAAIFYKQVSGAWVDQTGTIESSGAWSGSSCRRPAIYSPTLTPGASYRVAVTMRNRPWGGSLRSILLATLGVVDGTGGSSSQ
jgi:hypothetical protein